jgi:hypothetical protein
VDSPYVLIIYRKDKVNTGVNNMYFVLGRIDISGISAQAVTVLFYILDVSGSNPGLHTGCPD